ncbi:antibiotic biosynthesis monooxygenase family protein [Streptomyces apocyni]|uniref:antibiotic biosynthesis monooxygenase n=1 Tax=Streptomyces apocyni TaxID=2654677 RepID=UPI0012E9D0A3|nr:antibiotic biosynthesis monooxygenase [Streptomyces apocyni]
MSVRIDTLPRITRPGVGAVLVSTWRVGTPERQRAAVDAIRETWEGAPWPTGDLLSYSVYTGTDGDTLLHYSQWRDVAAYDTFVQVHRDGRNARIDAAVPGIQRVALNKYELYRSGGLAGEAGEARAPGAIVIVDVEFDGPDAARQRAWVDAVFEALESDEKPHPGGISGHFHVSLDGTRVLNYAEWESEQAHIEALAGPGEGIGTATPEWHRVQNFPGLTGGGSVKRYLPALSLSDAGRH